MDPGGVGRMIEHGGKAVVRFHSRGVASLGTRPGQTRVRHIMAKREVVTPVSCSGACSFAGRASTATAPGGSGTDDGTAEGHAEAVWPG
jgi:hypothetical protein